ncbi:MAG: hypothetical protein RL699_631 [Bacteroidota bacterium]|jgi:hypothetical protein
MKKLFIPVFASILIGFSAQAQMSKIELEKQFGPLVNQEVPASLQSKQTSTFEQVLPIYGKNGGKIVLVVNEYGIKNFYTSKGVVANAATMAQLETKLNASSTSTNRCGFLCWLEIIRDLLTTIIEVLNP